MQQEINLTRRYAPIAVPGITEPKATTSFNVPTPPKTEVEAVNTQPQYK